MMDFKECLHVGFFCIIILAPLSLSEHFEVSSPPSVIGNLGQDVVLPCQISLQTQPKNMEVKWDIIGDKSIDNIYQFTAVTGQETFGPGYLGRIGLVKEGMATGNVSLKLKEVQINDEGTYRCVVKSSDWIAQTKTVIHVAALGNVSIEVLGPEGEGMKLSCISVGWFPEPELRWLAKKSQNLQLKSKQDHEQLFSVWSNITVLRDTGEITCSIHERSHLQRTQESTILLSRDIFPDTSPWLSPFYGLLTVTIILSVGVGVAVYCRFKEKQKESKREQDENEKKRLLEDQHNEELTRLHQEKEQLILQYENQRKSMESENQDQIQKLENQTKTMESENQTLKKTNEDQEVLLDKCREGMRRMQQESQDQLQEHKHQMKTMESENRTLKKKLEDQKVSLDKCCEEKRRMQQEKQDQLQKFGRQMKAMESEKEEGIQELGRQMKAMESEYDQKVLELESEIRTLKSEKEEEIQELGRQMKAMETEKENLRTMLEKQVQPNNSTDGQLLPHRQTSQNSRQASASQRTTQYYPYNRSPFSNYHR